MVAKTDQAKPKAAKKPRKLKYITEPFPGLFQVRLKRADKHYSRCFGKREYGSRAKALVAAQTWRDQVTVVTFEAPATRKTRSQTTGITGLNRYSRKDNRRDSNTLHVGYQVSWIDAKGKHRMKTFQAGVDGAVNAEQELHTFLTAREFRLVYETERCKGKQINVDDFKHWRSIRMYGSRRGEAVHFSTLGGGVAAGTSSSGGSSDTAKAAPSAAAGPAYAMVASA